MNYVVIYIKTHLKYFWVYLITFVTLYLGIVVSLLLMWLLSMSGMNDIFAWYISLLIGSAIASAPLFYPNYLVAKIALSKYSKNPNIQQLLFFNHIISYLFYLILFYLVMQNI